jgi:hypothetical protein
VKLKCNERKWQSETQDKNREKSDV